MAMNAHSIIKNTVLNEVSTCIAIKWEITIETKHQFHKINKKKLKPVFNVPSAGAVVLDKCRSNTIKLINE